MQKVYQGNLWNFKKTIKKTSGAFTYYAYPSKNQKEAWIYKIEIKGGKNSSKLSIPSRLDKKKVTRLGRKDALIENDIYNIFGEVFFPGSQYEKAGAKVKRIKKLVLPDTIKIIQPAAFCMMPSLKTVKISKSVKTLERYTFYRCEKLNKAEFSAELKKLEPTAFQDCPRLTDIRIASKNKTFQVKNNCVITKKKKELVFALAHGESLQIPDGVKVLKKDALGNCRVKTVHIPASVTKIERGAFSSLYSEDLYEMKITHIEDVTVDEKNSVYARDGQCIYHKKDKSLAVAIWDESGSLYISEQVELLIQDKISSVGPCRKDDSGTSKVVYPKN